MSYYTTNIPHTQIPYGTHRDYIRLETKGGEDVYIGLKKRDSRIVLVLNAPESIKIVNLKGKKDD